MKQIRKNVIHVSYVCIYVCIYLCIPFPPVCCLCLTNLYFISLETSSDQSGQIFHLEEASEKVD